jgi:DNA-binding PadR family transcriptional regulator
MSSKNLLESLPLIKILLLVIMTHYPNATGYEMMSYIQKHTNNVINPKSGTIYSELRKLESDKLVKSILYENGRKKRRYQITKKGEVNLNQLIQNVNLKVEKIIFPIISLYKGQGDAIEDVKGN